MGLMGLSRNVGLQCEQGVFRSRRSSTMCLATAGGRLSCETCITDCVIAGNCRHLLRHRAMCRLFSELQLAQSFGLPGFLQNLDQAARCRGISHNAERLSVLCTANSESLLLRSACRCDVC